MNIFHLAIPTHNISEAKKFYVEGLGAEVGREYSDYVIFNFYGTQLVCHRDEVDLNAKPTIYPRHFGIIFDQKGEFDRAYEKAKSSKLKFHNDAFERFSNTPAAHNSFFLRDPSNNLIEFKFYQSADNIFSK